MTALINRKRKDEGLGLAEERAQPGEDELLDEIIAAFTAQMRGLWNPGHFERGGNTKTHGIVRAEFVVRDDLPEHHAPRHLRGATHLPRLGAVRRPGPVRDRRTSTTSAS